MQRCPDLFDQLGTLGRRPISLKALNAPGIKSFHSGLIFYHDILRLHCLDPNTYPQKYPTNFTLDAQTNIQILPQTCRKSHRSLIDSIINKRVDFPILDIIIPGRNEVGGWRFVMPKVLSNVQVGPLNWKMQVHVPKLVHKAKPGQFVIVRVNDCGERVPMSIAGLDSDSGLLTIVYQVVGKTSALMTTVPKR